MVVGDVVLVKDINTFRGNLSLGKVTELIPSSDGLVRRVKLLVRDDQLGDDSRQHMKQKLMERHIHKLIILLKSAH